MGGASPWRRELAGAAAEERGEVAVGGAARGEVVMALGVGADRREPGSPAMEQTKHSCRSYYFMYQYLEFNMYYFEHSPEFFNQAMMLVDHGADVSISCGNHMRPLCCCCPKAPIIAWHPILAA